MYSRKGVSLENQGIRLAMGGQLPRSDPDCLRQLIDEWCSLRSANVSLVNLSAMPAGQPPAFAGVHVSLVFMYQHFFVREVSFSVRPTPIQNGRWGKVLKGMPWLADNTGSLGLVRLFRSAWGALSMRRCLIA